MQLAKNNTVPHEYLSHQKIAIATINKNKENYPEEFLNDLQIPSDGNKKEPFKLSALSNTNSLRKYLLCGSAWKSLVLLQTLGVEVIIYYLNNIFFQLTFIYVYVYIKIRVYPVAVN